MSGMSTESTNLLVQHGAVRSSLDLTPVPLTSDSVSCSQSVYFLQNILNISVSRRRALWGALGSPTTFKRVVHLSGAPSSEVC